MKKIYLIGFAFFTSVNLSFGQSNLWEKIYKTEDYSMTTRVELDDDENIYIVGKFEERIIIGNDTLFEETTTPTQNYSSGGEIFIAKLDTAGNPLWARKYIGAHTGHANQYERVRQLRVHNDNLILTGYIDVPNGRIYSRPFVLILDANTGNTIAETIMNTTHTNYGRMGDVGNIDTAGNIIIGAQWAGGSPIGWGVSYVLAKYDTLANETWRIENIEGLHISSTTFDENGDIYIMANCLDSIVRLPSTNGSLSTISNPKGNVHSCMIIKYSGDGNLLWSQFTRGACYNGILKADNGELTMYRGKVQSLISDTSYWGIYLADTSLQVISETEIWMLGYLRGFKDLHIDDYGNIHSTKYWLGANEPNATLLDVRNRAGDDFGYSPNVIVERYSVFDVHTYKNEYMIIVGNIFGGANINGTTLWTGVAQYEHRAYVAKVPFCKFRDPIETDTVISMDTLGLDIGSIDVNVTDGVAPFQYLWNTGDTTNYLDSLIGGNYSLEITDTRGCVLNETYFVPQDTLAQDTTSNTSHVISKNSVTIYPNVIHANAPQRIQAVFGTLPQTPVSIKVYDTIGRLIQSQENILVGNNTIEIDLNTQTISNGLLLLVFEYENTRSTHKIIVHD